MIISPEMKNYAMMILNNLKAQSPDLIDDDLYAIARDKIMSGVIREKKEPEPEVVEAEGR